MRWIENSLGEVLRVKISEKKKIKNKTQKQIFISERKKNAKVKLITYPLPTNYLSIKNEKNVKQKKYGYYYFWRKVQ